MKTVYKVAVGAVIVAVGAGVAYGGYRMYRRMKTMEATAQTPLDEAMGPGAINNVRPLDAAAVARVMERRAAVQRNQSNGVPPPPPGDASNPTVQGHTDMPYGGGMQGGTLNLRP